MKNEKIVSNEVLCQELAKDNQNYSLLTINYSYSLIIKKGGKAKWQNQQHKDKGWETFTDNIIKTINLKTTPVVFILWGSYAKAKKSLITNPIHYIIESAHPSPFSAYNGFFGSKPFSKTNAFLRQNNIKEINWRIE